MPTWYIILIMKKFDDGGGVYEIGTNIIMIMRKTSLF